MSADARNVVSVQGRMVTDPELIGEKIAKFRLAIDMAGNERGSDDRSGYFDVTFFRNEDQNSLFIFDQIAKQNFKKGTSLTILGRMVQERWDAEGKRGQKVVIYGEAASYAGSKPAADGGDAPTAQASSRSNDETSLPTKF